MTKRRYPIPLLVLLLLSAQAQAVTRPASSIPKDSSNAGEPVTIRVGLESLMGKLVSLAVISAEGIAITDARAAQCFEAGEGQTVRLTPKNGKIEVLLDGEESLLMNSPVTLSPNNGGVIQIAGKEMFAGRRYRGCLVVSGSTALSVVNELPLEDYVKGVVPNEVDSRFHPEARKALTIAIRTYALASKSTRRHTDYDVCTTTHCQGFAGANYERDWVNEVVDETRGQVITYKGQVICAAYSSNCGGATSGNETAGFGTDPRPYLRPVVDNECGKPSPVCPEDPLSRKSPCEDHCKDGAFYTWTRTYSVQELGQAFARVKGAIVGGFESMEFADYDSSGRVGTVVVRSRANPPAKEPESDEAAASSSLEPPRVAAERPGKLNEYRMPGYKFRTLLGEAVIMSTRMVLRVTPEGHYVIDGKGYGHGVGLCSAGANGMAKRGKTCDEILKHYYTGVEISAIAE